MSQVEQADCLSFLAEQVVVVNEVRKVTEHRERDKGKRNTQGKLKVAGQRRMGRERERDEQMSGGRTPKDIRQRRKPSPSWSTETTGPQASIVKRSVSRWRRILYRPMVRRKKESCPPSLSVSQIYTWNPRFGIGGLGVLREPVAWCRMPLSLDRAPDILFPAQNIRVQIFSVLRPWGGLQVASVG